MFQVDAVECWLVQQPEEEENAPPTKAGGSVLDRCACLGPLQPFPSLRNKVVRARLYLQPQGVCMGQKVMQSVLGRGCALLEHPCRLRTFPHTRRFKEDRHLLDLAGRGTQASAGIREARPEDDL